MRIFIFGAKDWQNEKVITAVLKKFNAEDVILIQNRPGVGILAERLAKAMGLAVDEYVPDHMTYGNRATFVSNKEILNEGKPTLIVLFHDALDNTSKEGVRLLGLAKDRGIKTYGVKGDKVPFELTVLVKPPSAEDDE